MNLTAEEKLMYAVMRAIYDSGIPVNFKGSMVLKACLLEAGHTDETRHTVDIDANWFSATPPTGPQMVESLEKAIIKAGLIRIIDEREQRSKEKKNQEKGGMDCSAL